MGNHHSSKSLLKLDSLTKKMQSSSKSGLFAKYLERFQKLSEMSGRLPTQEEMPKETDWFNVKKPLLFDD